MSVNRTSIDLNCDMGEGSSDSSGIDARLMPLVTSANICCGEHAGDRCQIEKTIALAVVHDVQIGAHPGYADRENFGRRAIEMKDAELISIVKFQIATLQSLTENRGGQLTYVKPHGAMYHAVHDSHEKAQAFLDAVRLIDESLAVMGMPNGKMAAVCKDNGTRFIAEAFGDRYYGGDGKLIPRNQPDASIKDADAAAVQSLRIARQSSVVAVDGTVVNVNAETICVHGDGKLVLPILKSIRQTLFENGIAIERF